MNLKNNPYSTCTLIIKEIFESYSERKLRTERNLRNILDNEGMESHKIEELIAKLSNDDPFTKARSELESERKRLQYVKESFDYTPPETVILDHF